VRSIYAWIVYNIRYDHRLAASPKRKKVSLKTILKTRKAVCAGYADLLGAMCKLAGIESEVVTGYSRCYNFGHRRPFSWSDHAWNAVKLGGNWYLLDATWESKR
jgi:transglutaminase/protease-like cytokinesis protein 3